MKQESKLQELGIFYSNIVGVQYYENKYRAGDEVYFERNPYNEYDDNAIEVQNERGVIGHLKREQAAFIGPLMDAGEIYLKGSVIDEGDKWRIPIRVEVKVTQKGIFILEECPECGPENVIHNHLLRIYGNALKYDEKTLSDLREYYRSMMNMEGILPETRLIFKLLKNQLEKNRRSSLESFIENARDYCRKLKFGTPVKYESLTVVPLISDEPAPPRYVSGKKALKDGSLIIEEIGESGQVSKLRATNRGDKPVLLISGQGLKGAKQDRIVNVTVIIEVNATVDIPVSCVERGRWSYEERDTFESANVATQTIRFSISKDINKDVKAGKMNFASDQDMVWHQVAEASADYGIKSKTDNLNEVYSKKKADFDKIISRMKYVKNAVGMATFLDGEKVSVDLFQQPDLMEDTWDDLVQSTVMELSKTDASSDAKAMKDKPALSKKKLSDEELHQEIKDFFDQVFAAASEPAPSPGTGNYVVSTSEKLEAGTLVNMGTVAHLSGFMER